MMVAVLDMAENIAQKSPVAVQTTKRNLVYSMDNTIQDGLDQIRILNQLHLQSEDFMTSMMSQLTSKGEDVPEFNKL